MISFYVVFLITKIRQRRIRLSTTTTTFPPNPNSLLISLDNGRVFKWKEGSYQSHNQQKKKLTPNTNFFYSSLSLPTKPIEMLFHQEMLPQTHTQPTPPPSDDTLVVVQRSTVVQRHPKKKFRLLNLFFGMKFQGNSSWISDEISVDLAFFLLFCLSCNCLFSSFLFVFCRLGCFFFQTFFFVFILTTETYAHSHTHTYTQNENSLVHFFKSGSTPPVLLFPFFPHHQIPPPLSFLSSFPPSHLFPPPPLPPLLLLSLFLFFFFLTKTIHFDF